MTLKLTIGALALLAVAAPVAAAAPDRAAIETIVHDYILAHPDIIPEALRRLDARRQAEMIRASHATIETPFGAEWEGNPQGDVTMVEFFDYNCGYCRASVADVKRLLAEDKKLKVVYREIPVLGAESDAAAVASLGLAKNAGDWPRFHRAVYAAGDASPESVAKAAHLAGYAPIDAKSASNAASTAAARNEINANLSLAQKLGVSGTPSWVIGDKMLSGAVGYEELKLAIAETRKTKHR